MDESQHQEPDPTKEINEPDQTPHDPLDDESNIACTIEDEYADLKLSESCYGPPLFDGAGRYRLIRLVGSGTQGKVYKAIDRQFANSSGSLVAIKVFHRPGSIEGVRAKRVDHSNVVRVIDQGIDPREQSAFVVYDYLSGQSLEKWAGDQSLSSREIIRLMITICEATEAIHARSIVHRDLKPGNIIMHGDQPMVVDFGIASHGLGEPPLAGSPAYMAPEQYDGAGESIMVDVFGLGGIAFYLLAGKPPTNKDGSRAILEGVHLSTVHKPLISIIDKSLAIDPLARYQSVHALREDLVSIIEHRPSSICKQGFPIRMYLFARRYPAALIVCVVFMLIFVGLTEMIMVGSRENESLNEKLIDTQNHLTASNLRESHIQMIIDELILDMRMSADLDPSRYWAIARLSELLPPEWAQELLSSPVGAYRLHTRVNNLVAADTESTITIGYWWMLVGRVYIAQGDHADEAKEALYQARNAFMRELDHDDPIVIELGELIDGIE